MQSLLKVEFAEWMEPQKPKSFCDFSLTPVSTQLQVQTFILLSCVQKQIHGHRQSHVQAHILKALRRTLIQSLLFIYFS